MANSAVVGILRAILTADTAQFQAGMKSAASSARAWQKDLQSIGQQATAAGRSLTTALTLPILGVGAASAKAFMDFESSFAGVRKTVNASEPEFQAMAQQFRDLAKQIPISVNELNRLGEAAGALGIPKAEVVDFARVMALLGVTTNLTSDQAAESIAKIQNIFGAAGKDTERFASTLVALGNDGASTETQIVEMAARIAGAGNAVNMTQGQVLAFASALSSVGIEAEMGGSAISRVFINMSKAVNAGGDDLRGFAKIAGESASDFAARFKTDAAGAVNEFIVGLNRVKTSGGDLIGTIEGLGFSEIRVRDTLLRAAGAGDLLTRALDLQKKAWSDNTAMAAEAEKRFATMKSQLTLLWNQIRDVGIELGMAMKPAMEGVMRAVKEILPYIESAAKWFAGLSPGMQTAIVAGFGLVAALGPLLFLFGQMATGASTLIGLFTKKGLAMRALGAAATEGSVGVGLMSTALSVLTKATWVGAILGSLYALKIAYDEMGDAAARAARQQQGVKNKNGQSIGNEVAGQVGTMVDDLAAQAAERRKKVIEGLIPTTMSAADAEDALNRHLAKNPPLTDEVTAAEKKLRDQRKEMADEISGRALQKEMDQLAVVIKSLNGVISQGQMRELAKQLQEAADAGAVLDPVLERIRAQADTTARGWAFFTTLIQANTAARKDAADRAEKYSDDEIKRTQQLIEAREKAMKTAVETADKAADATMKASLSATDYAIYQAGRQRDESLAAIEPLKRGIPGTYEVARRNVLAVYDEMVSDAKNAATKTVSMFQTALADLPRVILAAIQGGGGVGNAIASHLGAALFGPGSSLNTLLNKGLSSMATKIGGGFIANLAQSMSAALPGLGALIGPAISGLVGKLFQGNDTKKGRESLAQSLGFRSLAELNQALGSMGEEGRRLLDEGLNKIGKTDSAAQQKWEENVRKLFDDVKAKAKDAAEATQKLNDELANMQDELTDLQAHSKPTWEDMLEAANAFGVEIGALGGLFQQQRLDAEAKKWFDAFETMRLGGADMNGVLAGMSDELQDLVLQSLQFRTTIPENMKPMIQSLIDQGLLLDENGEKITDISRINFGEPIKSKWDLIGEAIEKLIVSIEKMIRLLLGPAVDAAEKVRAAMGSIGWDDGASGERGGGGPDDVLTGAGVASYRQRANGEYFTGFGPAAMAMQGRERTMPAGDLLGAHGTPAIIENVINFDGAEVARNQAPHLVVLLNAGGI